MDYHSKSREELINGLLDQKQEFDSLKILFNKEINDRKQIQAVLKERLKELSCHDQISEVMSNSELSVYEICEKIVQIIPSAWQFPEIAEASIQIPNHVFSTPGYKPGKYSMVQDLKINNTIKGQIEVSYPVDKLPATEQLFLPEESSLLFSIAVKLGNFLEKKEKGLALEVSEEKYKDLIENISDVIYTTDNQGNITFISPSIIRLLGYSPEDIIGKNFSNFTRETTEHLKKRFEEIKDKSELQSEYQILSVTGEPNWMRFSSKALIKEGQFVGVTGTIFDITEKKQIELELQKSESLYRSILQASPDTIFIADLEGHVLFTSPMALKMFGYEHIPFPINSPLFDFVDPRDHAKAREAISLMFQGVFAGATEYVGIKADGSTFDMEANGEFIRDAEGNPTSMVFVVRDISDRNLAEKKLIKSEETYRNLVESINDILYEITIDGTVKYVSPAIERLFNLKAESLIGQNFFGFVHPEDQSFLLDIFRNNRFSDYKKIEYRCIIETGETVWVQASARNVYDEDRLVGRSGILRDITEQKLAEEKLRKSEEQYRKLVESVNDVIFDIDATGNIKFISQSVLNVLGYTVEEAIGQNIFSFLYPEDVQLLVNAFKNLSSKDYSFMEYRYVRKDGSIRWVRSSTTPQIKDGEMIGATGIITDVTERKVVEDELRKLSQAVEQSPVSIVITDLDGNIEYANPKASQTTGYTLEELKGKNPRVLKSGETPNDEYQYLWDSISHGNIWRGIFHNKRKNGELYWESSQITPITDANGNITSYLAIKEDITERKQIQEELVKSEDRFREITEQSQNVIWETNSEAVYTFVSQASVNVWGLKPSDLIGKKRFFDIHPEEGRKEFIDACLQQIHTGKQFRNMESLVQGDDGKMNWVMTNGMPYLDSEGNVKGYRGSSLNINQQKSDFEELKQSEDRYKSIFRNNHSVMMIIDPETGAIKDVNSSASDYYKLSYDEMCSKNIYEINILTKKEVQEEMQKAKIEMRTQFFFKHRLGNGEIRDVEVYSCPLKFGDSILLFSIIHDITDRRIAEVSLFQRERDLNFSQEIAGMGSWQINMVTNTSKWSDNMYQIFGLDSDKDKASQDLFFELIHPDDRHLIDEYIEKILRDRKQVSFEMRLNLKSGKTIWIQNSMIPGFEGGQLVTLNGTNVDITNKKLAEEALKISEAALNQAQEISKMCSWELDLITKKLTWSKNYYHLMGIPDGTEMKIEYFQERVHPEDIHLVEEKLEEMKRFKKPVNYDIRLRMPDNEYRWIQNNIVPEFEDGKLIRYKGVNIDVTEKKLAEENIRQQNERLSAIIDALPDLIFISDREGTYLEYYNASNQILLYSADKLIGSTVRDVFDEETANLHIRKINECLQTKNLVTFEYTVAKNGTYQYLEARLAPLGNDKVLRFVRDFTQVKQKDNEIKKLSLAVEQSPIIIVITDLSANIEYINQAFSDITGYRKEEVIGQNVRILQSGETDKLIYKQLWETIKAGKEWHGEWINKKKNGELYWEDVLITPVRDDSGKVTNYLAVKQDITHRKRTEEELNNLTANLEISIVERTSELTLANYRLKDEIEERKRIENALSKSEKSYRTVVENVNEVIFQTDPEGLWVFLNKSWTDVTGFSVEESLGQLFVNYVHPDDRSRNWELFEPLINRKKDYCRHEIRYLTKDGGFRWVEVFARLGLNDNDEITGTYGTLMDITERKFSEESLSQISTRLTLALRAGRFGVWDYDIDNNVLYWDSQMFEIYGVREEDFTSAYDAWLKVLHPDDKIRGDEEIQMAIRGEKEFDTEFRVVWPDGSVHYIRALGTVQRDNSGHAQRVIGTNWDITNIKRAADFENEMLQLSPQLTGIAFSEINSVIDMAIGRIGKFLSADRSYIFEFNAGGDTMSNTHEWCNEGINPEIENLQGLPHDLLPHWMGILNRNENIIIPSVKDLPESWKLERDILESQGIQSLIAIPLLTDATLIGFVGLDSVAKMKEYNSEEINILKVWSSMLASLIKDRSTETLLEQTRQNYETFFNTIDDFLWVLDEQGNIIHMNKTVKTRLEYSEEELFHESVLMVHPPTRREEAGRIVGEMLAGTSEFCPVPIVTKSGRQIPVETRVKAGFWNGVPAIFGVSKDISQIQLSEQKFSSAFQSNSSIMVITRFTDDQFVDVNNAFINTLGYSREEILGKTLVTLGIVSVNPEEGTIQDAINRGIPVREIEINAYSKSNESFIFLLSAEEIYIGSERCVLSVAVNITERKTIENELRNARKEADLANIAKSEFLSRMSHELRTPMNSILGFGQLLEMGELTAGQKKGVGHILKSGKHLLDLINEVLDISRIEAGKLSLSIEPVQLSGMILEMIDIVNIQANERQIKIELITSPANQMFVKSDRQRLKQVLLNLLNNAIKYNRESGSVLIKTEIQPANDAGIVMIKIAITDTGRGISAEDLPKLFTPFERIGAERSATEGTGLGLTVVKKIIDALGGIIGVESVLGEGSCFWFELPYVESQLVGLKKSGGLSGLEANFDNKTGAILYIEDNESNIELVEQILSSQRSNIQLITRTYGKQALGTAIEYMPDLILLDLDLPDVHGSDVLKQLKANEKTMGIPVIIISANAMPNQIDKLSKEGAENYLTKPLNVIDFLKVIDEYIANKNTPGSSELRGANGVILIETNRGDKK